MTTQTNTVEQVVARLANNKHYCSRRTQILNKANQCLRYKRNKARDLNRAKFEFHCATGVRSKRSGEWRNRDYQFDMTQKNVERFIELFSEATKDYGFTIDRRPAIDPYCDASNYDPCETEEDVQFC